MKWWNDQGLSFKVAFSIAITMVVIFGVVFLSLSQYFKSLIWQAEIQKTENISTIAQVLLNDAMMAGRKDIIQNALDQLGKSVSNQQLYSIAVYNDQFSLTSFATGFPGSPSVRKESMPTNIEDPSCSGCHRLPPEERPSYLVVTSDGRKVIRYSVPLYNEDRCQTCHGTGLKILGDIMVDFSQEQFIRSYQTINLGLGVGISLAIIIVVFVLFQIMRRIVIKPLSELVTITDATSRGEINHPIEIQGNDEISHLAKSFKSMVIQLRELISSLEQRIKARTQSLETAAIIGRKIMTILDIHQLIVETVNQLQQAFGYYHVHIYLYDDQKEFLMMSGGTGEAGKILLQQKHKIPSGKGLVGRAVEMGSVVLVSDTRNDPTWLPNPLLPETRSEAVVPIMIGNEVLGALDVQQNIINGISQQDIDLLLLVSSQTAVAIRNARLYEDVEKRAEQERNISNIVESIQSTTSITEALQVTAREIGRLLRTPITLVKLHPSSKKD